MFHMVILDNYTDPYDRLRTCFTTALYGACCISSTLPPWSMKKPREDARARTVSARESPKLKGCLRLPTTRATAKETNKNPVRNPRHPLELYVEPPRLLQKSELPPRVGRRIALCGPDLLLGCNSSLCDAYLDAKSM